MKKIIKVAGDIACALAAVILIVFAVMFFSGIRPAVVISGSMEPTITTGSLAFIDTKYDELEKNDIVAFERGGTMVIHRLIAYSDTGWITKGDANEDDDPWRVEDSEIKGKTVFWVSRLGYLIGKGERKW